MKSKLGQQSVAKRQQSVAKKANYEKQCGFFKLKILTAQYYKQQSGKKSLARSMSPVAKSMPLKKLWRHQVWQN